MMSFFFPTYTHTSSARYLKRPGHNGDPSPVIGSQSLAAGKEVLLGQHVPADVQALVPVDIV